MVSKVMWECPEEAATMVTETRIDETPEPGSVVDSRSFGAGCSCSGRRWTRGDGRRGAV